MNYIFFSNIGTPESPEPDEVGKYLSEFLKDPWVIRAPYPIRKLLVDGLIVPKRKYESAKKYASVWTAEGSPLAVFTEEFISSLNQCFLDRSKFPETRFQALSVMRYGQPSFESVIVNMRSELENAENIYFVPFFPQYSEAATRSSIELWDRVFKKHIKSKSFKVLKHFWNEDFFIDPLTESLRREISERPLTPKSKVLFSYHGLPELHLKKVSKSCATKCLDTTDCCDFPEDRLQVCYRAQCFATTKRVVQALGLTQDQFSIAFQSRLGPTAWIKPHTDVLLTEWANAGIKDVRVLCPSFVMDCLETIEEVGLQFKEQFERQSSDGKLRRIPCLNSQDYWVLGVSEAFRRSQVKFAG